MSALNMTHEFAAAQQVPFKAYDLDYIWELPYGEGDLVRVDIHPVTIVRYGVNHEVGATAPSVTVRYHDGRTALSSVDMFYGSIEDARAAAAEAMAEAADNPGYDKLEERVAQLETQLKLLSTNLRIDMPKSVQKLQAAAINEPLAESPAPRPRLYVLGLSDTGCEELLFNSERERLEFLAEQDDCVDDWYTLDIYPSYIDFQLAGVGEYAQEQLDEGGQS